MEMTIAHTDPVTDLLGGLELLVSDKIMRGVLEEPVEQQVTQPATVEAINSIQDDGLFISMAPLKLRQEYLAATSTEHGVVVNFYLCFASFAIIVVRVHVKSMLLRFPGY